MRIWSGTTVEEKGINDIPAYNRANGIIWIVFSLFMWLCAVLGDLNMSVGGILLITGTVPAFMGLIFAYKRIYNKYKTDS